MQMPTSILTSANRLKKLQFIKQTKFVQNTSAIYNMSARMQNTVMKHEADSYIMIYMITVLQLLTDISTTENTYAAVVALFSLLTLVKYFSQ